MRRILFIMLFLFSSPFVRGDVVDANGWYRTDCEGAEWSSLVGVLVSDGQFFQFGGVSQQLTISELAASGGYMFDASYMPDFAGCVASYFSSSPFLGYLIFCNDITSFKYYFVHEGVGYGIDVPTEYVGDYDVGGWVGQVHVYRYKVIIPNSNSLQVLVETNGAGTGGGDPGGDYKELALWFSRLLETQNSLLKELNVSTQYEVGLLSFVGGMVLAIVFLMGLKLR